MSDNWFVKIMLALILAELGAIFGMLLSMSFVLGLILKAIQE